MTNEIVPLVVRETVTVAKFDGEPPAPGEHKEPVEVIELVLENGKEVSRTITKKEG